MKNLFRHPSFHFAVKVIQLSPNFVANKSVYIGRWELEAI
jgi:hypothetical protein